MSVNDRLERNRVSGVSRSIYQPRREASDRSPGRKAEISVKNGVAGAGNRRASQYRETVRRAENKGRPALWQKTGKRQGHYQLFAFHFQ